MTLPSKARLVLLRFVIVSSSYFFVCASVADGFVGDAGSTDSHVGAAPLLRMATSLNTPYRF
jgi:hypothetical protein